MRRLLLPLFVVVLFALLVLFSLTDAATISLTWDAPVWPAGQTPIPLQSYILERDNTEIARPLAPPYSDTVGPGVYTYAVRALYAGNQMSARSNAVTTTVPAVPALPTPINFTCVFTQPPDPTFTCQVVSTTPPGPYPRLAPGVVQVQGTDSQEIVGEDGRAINAVDGNAGTIWHTQWLTASPPLPHLLTLDLGSLAWVDGLAYLPRPAGELNGVITSYRLEMSSDLVTWTPCTTGTWTLDNTEKTVRFAAVKGRYVRLVALGSNGTPYASAAEVGIFAVPAP